MKVPLVQAIHTCHPSVKTRSGKMWQPGLNSANLPLLGSWTYYHSYCHEAPIERVKYVAHGASCLLSLIARQKFEDLHSPDSHRFDMHTVLASWSSDHSWQEVSTSFQGPIRLGLMKLETR